jgi:predicted MFS family arabinose efflux permease
VPNGSPVIRYHVFICSNAHERPRRFMSVAGPARGGVTAALRYRDFALLWGGQTVSMAGNGIYTVALPLEVLRLTRSPVDLALIVAARTVPSVLLLLIGGNIADKTTRRLLMLACDAICAFSVGVAAALIATGHIQLWTLGVLSAVFGLASAFFRPASTAIIPDILPAEMLVSASSLSSFSQSLAQFLLGPLAGGLVVAVIGPSWAFGLDAGSFVVSAACLAVMRTPGHRSARRGKSTDGIMAGLRFCRSQPWLWWSMIGFGIGNLACYAPIFVLEPLLVKRVFDGGPMVLGILFAASGLGGVAASFYAGRRPAPRRPMRVIWLISAFAGLAAVALGLAPWLWLAIVCVGVVWAGISYVNLQWFPVMQREIPSDMLGRASSVDWAVSLALAPMGTVAGGFAAAIIGVRLTLVIGGLAAAAGSLVLFIPGVTAPDSVPNEAVTPRVGSILS